MTALRFDPTRMGILVAGGVAAVALAAVLAGPIHGPATLLIPTHVHAQMKSGTEPGARPKSEVTTVSCELLPNAPGKSMTLQTVVYPPNALTPAHRHPGSVTAFVLYGKVRSQLDGGPVGTFGLGGTWFEPPGTRHDFVENASATEPASILAVQVADSNCGPLLIPEP